MRRTVKNVRTENRADKLMKTPANQRGSYKYIHRETETINGVVHDITETIEIVPGEDSVTAADIKLLHSMDDHDVYENLKNRRPELEDWQKQIIADYRASFIQRFIEQNGYEPDPDYVEAVVREMVPRNWVASFDDLMSGADEDDDDMGDKASFLYDVWKREHQPKSRAEERLAELVETWSDSWKEIYARVLIGGESIVTIARERGVNESAVRKTVRKIRAAIAADDELHRICTR